MKALVPAAGKGTRFAPVTRAVPKEMLPVGAKPAIQLLVEEAREAGADEVVVVISREKELIRRYFADFDAGVRVTFAEQREARGLGHAVLQAAPLFAGEEAPALILLGDALVSGASPSEELVAASRARGGASVIGFERVPPERVSRYGIARADERSGADFRLADLVEKPLPEDAPSDLAVAGRYLLSPRIFGLLANQQPGRGGEIQLTDAIRRLLALERVWGRVCAGRRHDIGDPDGYFETLCAFRGQKCVDIFPAG